MTGTKQSAFEKLKDVHDRMPVIEERETAAGLLSDIVEKPASGSDKPLTVSVATGAIVGAISAGIAGDITGMPGAALTAILGAIATYSAFRTGALFAIGAHSLHHVCIGIAAIVALLFAGVGIVPVVCILGSIPITAWTGLRAEADPYNRDEMQRQVKAVQGKVQEEKLECAQRIDTLRKAVLEELDTISERAGLIKQKSTGTTFEVPAE